MTDPNLYPQISTRVDGDLEQAILDHACRLSEQARGENISRSFAIRDLIRRGLEQVQKESSK